MGMNNRVATRVDEYLAMIKEESKIYKEMQKKRLYKIKNSNGKIEEVEWEKLPSSRKEQILDGEESFKSFVFVFPIMVIVVLIIFVCINIFS